MSVGGQSHNLQVCQTFLAQKHFPVGAVWAESACLIFEGPVPRRH